MRETPAADGGGLEAFCLGEVSTMYGVWINGSQLATHGKLVVTRGFPKSRIFLWWGAPTLKNTPRLFSSTCLTENIKLLRDKVMYEGMA